MKSKSLLSLFLGLIALCVMNGNVNAQSTDSQVSPRLYIVTQTSANCTMCTDNNTRWNSEIVKQYSNDPSVVFINYDITDDNTMATTRADLDRYGIYNSLSAYNNPGSVYLIDPVTRQVVGTTTVSASTQDILKSINSGSPSPSK
ncbi:MAG: hypothetical protein J0M18_04130 [Ignavibacteria bacterium]|nr:hypothetical protein [Ignavibacteria bacterium]